MDIFSIFIISIGLAMDCFTVAIAGGINAKKINFSHIFRMAFMFGFFQAVMPLIGFFAGIKFSNYIKDIDHWVAFVILGFVGIKMIHESLSEDANKKYSNPFKWHALIILSLATSIDALATGIIFVSFPQLIWIAIGIIGITSFVFSIFGVLIGVHFGNHLTFKFEIAGGIILILIGSKILIEHLFF
jgi:putative Mn2+ efflux pump MntP